jgi:hypothetical protein
MKRGMMERVKGRKHFSSCEASRKECLDPSSACSRFSTAVALSGKKKASGEIGPFGIAAERASQGQQRPRRIAGIITPHLRALVPGLPSNGP